MTQKSLSQKCCNSKVNNKVCSGTSVPEPLFVVTWAVVKERGQNDRDKMQKQLKPKMTKAKWLKCSKKSVQKSIRGNHSLLSLWSDVRFEGYLWSLPIRACSFSFLCLSWSEKYFLFSDSKLFNLEFPFTNPIFASHHNKTLHNML